jgi:hypothetical protein
MTKDIDVLLITPHVDVHQALVRASLLDLKDYFQSQVEWSPAEVPAQPLGGVRFQVQSLLDRRRFETFHVDVGWGNPFVGKH